MAKSKIKGLTYRKRTRTAQALTLKSPKRLSSIRSKIKGATVAKSRPPKFKRGRSAPSGTKII